MATILPTATPSWIQQIAVTKDYPYPCIKSWLSTPNGLGASRG